MTRYSKGCIFQEMKQYHEAVAYYDKILEIEPKNVAKSKKQLALNRLAKGKKD